MALAQRVADALEKSFAKASSKHTKVLRQKALAAGWEPQAANSIQVTAVNGGFVASCGRIADKWEYGAEGRPPSSIVRVFNQRQHQDASQDFETTLSGLLGGLV